MKLLVVLHIHYEDQVDYFIEKLSVISGCDWDLVVTASNFSEELRNRLADFKPGAAFIEVENVGYDVWPFIKVLQETDIYDYDLILKLHTKNKRLKRVHINRCSYWGYGWRNELVDSLLGSPERFSEVLNEFENPETGMVCSRRLYAALDFPEDKYLLDAELERLGILAEERRFCIGTMFAIRPQCLRLFKEQPFSAQMFAGESHSGAGASQAHIYERILAILPVEYGYCVRMVDDPAFDRKVRMKRVIDPALKWLFTIDKNNDWEKYVQICGHKFFLDKGRKI